jgi:magnesium chelatase family protein
MDMAVYISSSVSEFADFVTGKYGSQESSSSVSVRVGRAIKAQVKRCVEKGIDPVLNCFIDSRLIRELCPMNDEARSFIKGTAVNSAVRSAFDLVRCLRIARTIADLDDSDVICARHLAEAVNYLPRVFPRVFPSPGSGRIKHS